MGPTLRLLFLDFDGVLNSWKYFDSRGPRQKPEDDIDEEAVRHINMITAQTGASIVVSSTWRRLFDPDWIAAMLARKGLQGRIIGSTPHVWPDKFSQDVQRGQEIATFLDSFPRPVLSYAILDDGNDMDTLTHRLVRTNIAVGVTGADATMAIQKLERELDKNDHAAIYAAQHPYATCGGLVAGSTDRCSLRVGHVGGCQFEEYDGAED